MNAHESGVSATEGPRAMGSRPEAGGTTSRREGFGRADAAEGMQQ